MRHCHVDTQRIRDIVSPKVPIMQYVIIDRVSAWLSAHITREAVLRFSLACLDSGSTLDGLTATESASCKQGRRCYSTIIYINLCVHITDAAHFRSGHALDMSTFALAIKMNTFDVGCYVRFLCC